MKIDKIVLIVIILLAIFLRFSGINHGYPPYHADEGMSYSQGIQMVNENTFDAHGYPLAYAYPNTVPFVNALFFKSIFIPFAWVSFWARNVPKVVDGLIHIPLSFQEYKNIYQLQILGERELNVLIWGRMIAAAAGVATVLVGFILTNRMFSKYAGLIVAFLLAINYRLVLNSHINLPDIYNALFLTVSVYYSYNLWKKPSRNNYILAAIFVAISFSVKFNIYSFFPFCLSYLYLTFEKKGIFLKNLLLKPDIYISLLIFLLTFMILNPHQLINIDETLKLLKDVSSKYATGKNSFDPYSYWYLYNIGIGKLTSIFISLGIIFLFFSNFKKSIFLLSAVLPALFILTYFSSGGFYTRNFVTFTPILIVFAFVPFGVITRKLNHKAAITIFVIIISILGWENLSNSFVVAQEYTKPWNYLVAADWLSKNIPPGTKVSAHSSILLPIADVVRLPYEYDVSYSMEEFKQNGAEYAVTNLDWATNAFYGWMGSQGNNPFIFSKPLASLENNYPAMSLRELSDFVIFTAINSWQAPDSHILVTKVPKYNLKSKTKVKDFPQTLTISGTNHWQSDPIEVENWEGFNIEYQMKTTSYVRDGFIWVNFYESLDDANSNVNRKAVRLSARNNISTKFNENTFNGVVPVGTKYIVVGIGLYDPAVSIVDVQEIKIYNSVVEMDLGGIKVNQIKLDNNLIFPNSHGYL